MLLPPEHTELSKEQILGYLSYVKEQVGQEDPMLNGLSQRRIMGNFYAFSELSLALLEQKDLSQERIHRLLREACYGLDEDSRRELQTD